MNRLDPLRAAREAVTANASRPATAIIHDTPDARLVVFRLLAGQAVAPHKSTSSVHLAVLEGEVLISGENDGQPVEIGCRAGDLVTFAPGELHGMRAESTELLLLATITPRPGSR